MSTKNMFKEETTRIACNAIEEMYVNKKPLQTKVCPFCYSESQLEREYVVDKDTGEKIGAFVLCRKCTFKITAKWSEKV